MTIYLLIKIFKLKHLKNKKKIISKPKQIDKNDEFKNENKSILHFLNRKKVKK